MTSEKDKERFPKNVSGPFYVANGECITCMAPAHAAPELMGFDEEARHCYFKRQPSTPEELERAVRAVWVSCCEAVQYSGDDPTVARLIAEYDEEGLRRMRHNERKTLGGSSGKSLPALQASNSVHNLTRPNFSMQWSAATEFLNFTSMLRAAPTDAGR